VKKLAARAVLVVAALSHPNSGLPEFGHFLNRPKSDKSDFEGAGLFAHRICDSFINDLAQ
jgi:hypothetical protein